MIVDLLTTATNPRVYIARPRCFLKYFYFILYTLTVSVDYRRHVSPNTLLIVHRIILFRNFERIFRVCVQDTILEFKKKKNVREIYINIYIACLRGNSDIKSRNTIFHINEFLVFQNTHFYCVIVSFSVIFVRSTTSISNGP